MLSCVQDYRPGSAGYQQHIWQATLGIDAVVFTNQPGSRDPAGVSPNFWAGNAMPRAATIQKCSDQYLPYSSSVRSQPYSHAYFPKEAFDEVMEKDHWVFGRKDNAYIALYAQHPVQWGRDTAGTFNELRSMSPDNVWIL